jgi:hypothetical protein
MLWSNHDSNISVGTTFIGSTNLQCRDHPRLDSPTRLEQLEKCSLIIQSYLALTIQITFFTPPYCRLLLFCRSLGRWGGSMDGVRSSGQGALTGGSSSRRGVLAGGRRGSGRGRHGWRDRELRAQRPHGECWGALGKASPRTVGHAPGRAPSPAGGDTGAAEAVWRHHDEETGGHYDTVPPVSGRKRKRSPR